MSAPTGTPPSLSPWQNTQPQEPPMAPSNGDNEEGVSVRPMRLKVLYTFDDQNKTNCLARWPHVLQIQTVAMDETTTIGVIELKTCINAIVQCSPELVARLSPDYTVYAYDYSEYDNPLVGQGMLSWALATASPTPDAPAHQSRQLITGRVCKNIMGLFTNGVKETLEVKLRLVPVPTVLQSEYLSTMEKYRELSKVLPPGFDPNEWTSFLQSNPGIGQMTNKPSPVPQPLPNNNQRDGVSMEVMNQLLSPSMQQQTAMDPFNPTKVPENPGSDVPCNTTTATGKNKANSRPNSRASVKRPRAPRKPKVAQNAGGNTSGYEEGTDGDEGPAPKKRAKVTKADWNSNTSLGAGSDSLRVAASTSGSLRLFRPIAMNPNQTVGPNHLQELPRAPTPVPRKPSIKTTAPADSSVRRDSFNQMLGNGRPHISPYPTLPRPEDQIMFSIESAQPSPERNMSPAPTPPEIGSSPPLMRTRPGTPMRSSPPVLSSPVLPQMPRTDSGFMSGSLEDLFGDDDNLLCGGIEDEVDMIPTQPPQDQRSPIEQPYIEFNIQEVMPGPVELLPTRMPIIDPPRQAESRAKSKAATSRAGSVMSEDGQVLPPLKKTNRTASRTNSMSYPGIVAPVQQQATPEVPGNVARRSSEPQQSTSQPPEMQQPTVSTVAPNSRPGSRMMARTASLGSLTFPQIPASDPALPPSSLQRSQTWSEAPHPATEAPIPPAEMSYQPPQQDLQSTRPGVPFSRTMQAKRDSIKNKLENAVANGEMPPYCSNCGAIDTPTWRKAWSKHMLGRPGYYEYSDDPGRVTAINILTRDDNGEPTSYQLIKKFLAEGENMAEFTEFLLCNPCGIWMSKYKTQRPENRWESNGPQERAKGGERKKPQQRPRAKKSQPSSVMLPTSEANFPPSEAYFPQSEANFPQSEGYPPQFDGMGPPEGISPNEINRATQNQQPQGATIEEQRKRSGSGRPKKRLNAMTSDAASAALRRAIQSSPARWAGTQHSPIEVEEEELGSTRRLLFPSPRKDGSPKVLGEVVANVVTIATEFRSPKGSMIESQNKENCPPAIDADAMDADLMKLFEEELAKGDDARPTTPVQKSPAANPFKTPTRPTPSHRPITRSVSRSIRSNKSPGQSLAFNQTPTRTPGTAGRRRSPRNHDDSIFESPFTATLNQMMSEANNQPSPTRHGVEFDFSNLANLPELPNMAPNHNYDMNFNIEDLFSTDAPMPSSPRTFNLYEDPLTRGGGGSNINWDEFGRFGPQEVSPEIKVKEEPMESPSKLGDKDASNEPST
ncbi:uncharacterized protein LY89DRAFT_391107 [Mollisia scopiformis]|uniref:Ams2/SPT21 N-terminal domain-containing protein n=1 Tax=Mollisia scopiformis TaxID=149040 RepID=A0A194XP36_MOLSC|nr:uncharacterized protein LY89DRAFT_391107 [Mollisia scopiformis]KUJ22010.1 hypothetical protein LY89DRAFT_391107 [Mollisia scopiformis]